MSVKSHQNIGTDDHRNKNVEKPAQRIAFIADLEDAKYFFFFIALFSCRIDTSIYPSYRPPNGKSRNPMAESVNLVRKSHIL